MSIRGWLFLFFLSAALFSSGPASGEGRWEEPWGKSAVSAAPKGPGAPVELSAGQRAGEGVLRFFQKYISPVDGDRCPSHPNCSRYGVEAVRKHGLILGLVLTFDRLLHESDEIRQAPLVKVGDSYRYYDPLENNDFWWDKK